MRGLLRSITGVMILGWVMTAVVAVALARALGHIASLGVASADELIDAVTWAQRLSVVMVIACVAWAIALIVAARRFAPAPVASRDAQEFARQVAGLTLARQAAERDAAEVRERLDRALGASRVCLWEADVETGIVTLSESWFEMLGAPPGQAQTTVQELLMLVPPEERESLVLRARAAAQARASEYRAEHRVRTVAGDYRWIASYGRVSARDATTGRVTRLAGHNVDISDRRHMENALRESESELRRLNEDLDARVRARTLALEQANQSLREEIDRRRRLEDQLARGQKLEAIGRVAAGLAHDFNNLLSVIAGYAEVLSADATSSDQRHASTGILDATRRGADLTRRLRAAGAREPFAPERAVQLNDLVSVLRVPLRSLLRDNIDLVLDLAPSLPTVAAMPVQIERVLLNLAANARDAMPNGGRLTLATTPSPDGVTLTVSDTGAGMDDETLRRAFEPLFTTKGRHGSGLGLASAFGIVEQHGGTIEVASQEGAGTTFTITLPRERAELPPATEATPSPPPDSAPFAGDDRATILLVDDDGDMRTLARRTLERAGYGVVEADCAETALALPLDVLQRCALVITDIQMPGLNGPQLAGRLLELHPALRLIYVTGATPPTPPEPRGRVLEKPLSTHAVRSVVDEILSGVASETSN